MGHGGCDVLPADRVGRLHPIADAVDTCVLALDLMDRLQSWVAAQGPPFAGRYCPVFSLSAAFVTPWLSPDVLYLGARIWSWITALDDLVDGAPGSADADAALRRCAAVLHDGAPDGDPLALALAGIRDDLVTLPGFPPLAARWRDSVRRLLDGMRFETSTGTGTGTGTGAVGGAPVPSLREYLGHAVHTVGVPMYLLSLWAAMPPADPAVLLPALRDAALAVRLANDLRGAEREGTERNLNALRLGLTVERAGRLIQERHDGCRRRLAPLLACAEPAAVAVERMATWGTRLYQRTDFRFPGGPPGGAEPWETFDWLADEE